MSLPQRIQLRRTKGWRMPANTVRVCRPGKWGNPFRAIKDGDAWILSFRSRDGQEYPANRRHASRESAARSAVLCYEQDAIIRKHEIRRELRGKNLACWCPIGSPCHADALLEIANSQEVPHG